MAAVEGGAMQGGKHALFINLLLPGQSNDRARGQIRDGSPVGGVLEVCEDLKESSLLFRKKRPSLLEVQVIVVVAVQPLSRLRLFANPWTAAHQAPLSFTISWSLLKLMSIESAIPSNHLILCDLLLLLSIFASIRIFFQ